MDLKISEIKICNISLFSFNNKLNQINVKMSCHHSDLFMDYQTPISFSFDNMSRIQAPKKSIDQFLRLRTNESIEDRPFSSKQLKKERKKPLRTQQSQIDDQHCLKLVQEEYDLRMQSLVKQYELKLNKQEEYFALKEWKLKEELQTLQNQNIALIQEIKKTKATAKITQSHCPLCSDGEIINQLTKMLADNEQNHKNCLTQKGEYNRRQNQLKARYEVLEEEHQNLSLQLRTMNKQSRLLQSKIREVEEERDSMARTLKQNENLWRQKMYNIEMQSKILQRQLAQKNVELNHSKATVQSVLSNTNTQQSLKSSYVFTKESKDPRQQKENDYMRGRRSLNKTGMIEEESSRQSQNRACLQRLGQNMPKNVRNQKYQGLNWKYF